MARTSITATKAELFALLATGSDGTPQSGLSPLERIFDHEPYPQDGAKPYWLTIATAGQTPTDWVIAMRIYGDGTVGAKEVQDNIDALTSAVMAKLTGPYGDSMWEIDWVDEIGCFVATCLLEVGREDDWA